MSLWCHLVTQQNNSCARPTHTITVLNKTTIAVLYLKIMAEESSVYEIAGKTSLTILLNDWQEPVAEALNEAAKAVS